MDKEVTDKSSKGIEIDNFKRLTVVETDVKNIVNAVSTLADKIDKISTPAGNSTHGFKDPETVADPSVKAALEVEATLLKQLANPRIVIYRGRKSCQRVNETQQALETVTKFLEQKWLSGAVRNIR